jgi:hypothetical protein
MWSATPAVDAGAGIGSETNPEGASETPRARSDIAEQETATSFAPSSECVALCDLRFPKKCPCSLRTASGREQPSLS